MRFEKDLQKAREFFKGLAKELGFGDDIDRADRVFRAVLRVIRRRISPQEYLDFIAQLPLWLKAEAINGWDLDEFPEKSIRHMDDFIAASLAEDKAAAGHDFGEDPKEIVRNVFRYLKKNISEGEIKDLAEQMPQEIKEFILSA